MATLSFRILLFQAVLPLASAAWGGGVGAQATQDTLLPLHYDAGSGKIYLSIKRLGQELLYFNTLAAGVGSTSPALDRGELGSEAVVRFERHGQAFRQQSAASRRTAGGSQPPLRARVPASPLGTSGGHQVCGRYGVQLRTAGRRRVAD